MDEIDKRQEESTINSKVVSAFIRGTTNVTLRDYFAAKAMLGMYAAGEYYPNQEERARVAYQMADEMLFIRDTE
jgi:hypothetical protein